MEFKKKKISIIRILVILFTVVTIIVISAFVYYYMYLNYEETLSCRITDDVIVINDIHSSMYLVKNDVGYIAIDGGYFKDIVEKGLEYNKINPESISAILLTHTDLDNQGVIPLFPNATVYFSQNEYFMVKDEVDRLSFVPWFTNKLNFKKYFIMKDGDEFSLGNRKIKCIALPGHTLGSMGFFTWKQKNKMYCTSGPHTGIDGIYY